MNHLLYYEAPAPLAFDATIVEIRHIGGHAEVVLDRTAFYPEGGGQPCDLGTINAWPVAHVRKDDGEVIHELGVDVPADIGPDRTVSCSVDAARRRDYAQQHSGQHVLSAALLRVGDYPTVSVHQGEEYTTIEIDAASIPHSDIGAAERIANDAIEADIPVETHEVTDAEIASYPLRRPPKVSGTIRLVQIGDLDCVACGGVHVERTGEIRLVRLYAVETIRGHVRLAFKIGDRAIDHYARTSSIAGELCSRLSVQTDEVLDRVGRMDERIRTVEAEARRANERIAGLTAEQLLARARNAASPGDGASGSARSSDPARPLVVTAAFAGESKEFLRVVTDALLQESRVVACLTNASDDRLQWSIGIGADALLEYNTVRPLLDLIDGKGGGRPPIWQGVGMKPEGVDAFLARFREAAQA